MHKKKVLAIILVLFTALLLTGCVQTVFTVKINPDMSGSLEMKVGILDEFSSMLGSEDPFADITEQAQEQGFTSSNYKSDGYSGVVLKADVEDITDSSGPMKMFSSDIILEVTTNGAGKKVITLSGDMGDVAGSLESQAGMSLESIAEAGKIDMRFIVELPYPATETNATSQSSDGKILTWDLTKISDGIHATAIETASESALLWIIIAGVIIIAAVVIIFIVVNKKKKAKNAQGGYQQSYSQGFDPNAQDGYQQQSPQDQTPPSDFPQQ